MRLLIGIGLQVGGAALIWWSVTRRRRPRETVHVQVALLTEEGMTLASRSYEHPVCAHVVQSLWWPGADEGDIVVMHPERLRVQVRAWKGPEGEMPPLPKIERSR